MFCHKMVLLDHVRLNNKLLLDWLLVTYTCILTFSPVRQVACKVVLMFSNYSILANYSWLLVEGHFLFSLVCRSFFSLKKHLAWYIVLSWGTESAQEKSSAPLVFLHALHSYDCVLLDVTKDYFITQVYHSLLLCPGGVPNIFMKTRGKGVKSCSLIYVQL